MSEKCILNLKEAMTQAGLSDDSADLVMAELDAEADNLRGASKDSKTKMYQEIFNRARREAVKKKIRQAADLEATLACYNDIMEYVAKGYNLEEHTRNKADGNFSAAVTGSANGYSNHQRAITQAYHGKILHRLQDAGGVDEHGNKNYIYEDMWNKFHESPDMQNTVDILKELDACNNKAIAESKGKTYDGPAPGHTGNTFAAILGEAISEVQQEHNAMLSVYGMNPEMIEHYFLPQKHFADNMQPDTHSKSLAFVAGYTSKKDGVKYRGKRAIDAMKQDAKDEWIEFTKGTLDIPTTLSNLQKIARTEKAPKVMKLVKYAVKIKEIAPSTAAAIYRGIGVVRREDITGVDLVFSKPVTKKHVSWKEKLENKLLHGTAQDKLVAQELLNNKELLDYLKKTVVDRDAVADLDTALGNIYESIVNPFDKMGIFDQLGKNQYQRSAVERILVYKDVDSWIQYQNKYGHANLAHAVLSMIDGYGKKEAYAKVFGSNAKATYAHAQELARAELTKRRNAATSQEEIIKYNDYIQQLSKQTSKMELYIRYVEGEFDRHSNSTGYRFIQWFMQSGKFALGQAMFPAIGDINNRLDVLSRVGLTGPSEYLPGLPFVKTLSYLSVGPIKKMFRDEQALVHSFTGMFSGMASRLTPAGLPEMSSAKGNIFRTMGQQYRKLTDHYLAWTFVNQLDEAGRMAVGDQLGTYLGNAAVNGATWDSLGKGMRTHMDMAGIGEKEWNIYKKRGVYKYGKAREQWAISAWQLEKSITPDDVAEYLGVPVNELTELDIRYARKELVSKYDNFIVGFANTAIVTPNIETRAFLQGGDSVNTIMRGVRAMFTEFLSYPTRIMFDLHRSLVRDFTKHGSGFRTAKPYFRVAKVVALGYFYGYMAMTLKDIANGREPRNPLDKDTILQALTIGGGLGLLGESVVEFAEMRSTKELYRWLGPSGMTLLNMVDDTKATLTGDMTEQRLADSMYRTFPNLVWTKFLMDKYLAAEFYKLFGATYDTESAKMRHQEKFGTVDDFVQLFTND